MCLQHQCVDISKQIRQTNACQSSPCLQAEANAKDKVEGVLAAIRCVQMQLNLIHQHSGTSEAERSKALAAAVRLKVALEELARSAAVRPLQ
jgi:hypothetical protein